MDNAIGLGIILSLRDKASAGLESIRNKMTALRDVSQEMVKKFDEGAKQMLAGFASMATGGKILGLLATTFGSSVATAADFEQAMARVGAVSGAVGEDFEALSKQARDLGRDTQFSASQAAASQENLSRAGFLTNEIISAMPGLLNMAAAEGMDLANAADIAASALRGFGMDASEMNRVSDVLAKTSAASNTSITLLGESLKYVAPIANGLGFSIEQVNAMLGVMANAGIKGSQAGTALKSAFQRLSAEPKQTAEALEQLGIKAKTSTGDMRPLPELMEDLAKKTQNMGKADKLGILSKVFGGVASSGMLAIMDSVANGKLPELEEALYHCSGAAQAMADRMNATAQGAMKRLESASEGLRIVVGNHLLPVYTWTIDKMAQFKSWLTQLIEAHPIISKAVIGFTTALLGLSGTALILVGALASIGGLIKMWPLLRIMASFALSSIRAQARTALISLSGLRVPIIGLAALAGILFYAWRKNLWGIRDMVTAVAEGFKMAWSASVDGIADVDDALMKKLKDAGIWDFAVIMGQVFFRVRKFWNGLVEGFKEGLDFILGAVDWLKGFFSPVIESGQELLKFLGILKPAAKTQVSTWKAWGQLVGRIAPAVIAVIAAFKGFNIITGIIGTVGQALMGMFSLIMAHPVVAVIAALVALGIYLYTHWEEISAKLAKIWNKIAGYGKAAADWVRKKWQGFMDWWNSWTMDDVFAAIYNWFAEKVDKVRNKWNEFSAWWDSWTFSDIFAPIYDFAASVCEKVKQPFIDFKNWLLGIFSNMNPFNWSLPSWLGGGKAAPSPQAQKAVVQGSEQGRSAGAVADRYRAAYGVKKVDSNAMGGVITQKTLSWVGEDGPEVIIPLTKQARGVSLWLEAGRELGLMSSNTPAQAHAEGGIFSQPHIGLVAEAGREAVIPLTKQARGASLWYEAGRELELMSGGYPSIADSFRTMQNVNVLNYQGAETFNQVMPTMSMNGGILSQPQVNIQSTFRFDGGVFSLPQVRAGLNIVQNNTASIIKFPPQTEAGRETVIPLGKRARGTSFKYTENSYSSPTNNILTPPSLNSVMELILPRMNVMTSGGDSSYGGDNRTLEAPNRASLPPVNALTFGGYNIINNIVPPSVTLPANRATELTLPRMNNPMTSRKGISGGYNALPFVSAPENKATELPVPRVNIPAIDRVALPNINVASGGNYFNNVIQQAGISLPPVNVLTSGGMGLHNFIFPHAEGGIFSSPHIGLVAEAGPEAVIPLADRAKAMPMLFAAMAMVAGDITSNVDINKPYSSSMLIQHSLNQSALYGQAVTPQEVQLAPKEAQRNSKIEVNAEIRPADIYIDGERVGRIAFRWIEHQNLRNGVSSF